jgi:hypothetical protein
VAGGSATEAGCAPAVRAGGGVVAGRLSGFVGVGAGEVGVSGVGGVAACGALASGAAVVAAAALLSGPLTAARTSVTDFTPSKPLNAKIVSGSSRGAGIVGITRSSAEL